MKNLWILAFLLVATNLHAQLTVSVKNITSNKGKIYIAIYNSEKSYLHVSDAFATKIIDVDNKKASFTFLDLPFASYSIAVFYDTNNNEKLDKNFVGIPKEPYGFSNNVRGVFGAPSYNETNFSYTKEKRIDIKIK